MSDGLFRIRAWVHYVSANPLNDDQLLLANDVAALLEKLVRTEAALAKCKDQRNDEGTYIQSGNPRERWEKYDAELENILKGAK